MGDYFKTVGDIVSSIFVEHPWILLILSFSIFLSFSSMLIRLLFGPFDDFLDLIVGLGSKIKSFFIRILLRLGVIDRVDSSDGHCDPDD